MREDPPAKNAGGLGRPFGGSGLSNPCKSTEHRIFGPPNIFRPPHAVGPPQVGGQPNSRERESERGPVMENYRLCVLKAQCGGYAYDLRIVRESVRVWQARRRAGMSSEDRAVF